MRVSLHNGVFSAVVGLAGAGAVIIWPNSHWIGYSLLLLAIGLLAWGIKIGGEHWWHKDRIRITWPYALAIFAAFGIAVGAYAAGRISIEQIGSQSDGKQTGMATATPSSSPALVPRQSVRSRHSHHPAPSQIVLRKPHSIEVPPVSLAPKEENRGEIYNNNGNNYGIMGHITNNYEKPPFVLKNKDLLDLLIDLKGFKKVKLAAIGLNSYSTADIIGGFLQSNGLVIIADYRFASSWAPIFPIPPGVIRVGEPSPGPPEDGAMAVTVDVSK